jgi:hypothetical protein
MADESTSPKVAQPDAKAKQSREQSTIQFPYGDLDDAIKVAQGLMACGGVPCDPDQLAGAMQQAPSSGSFRARIATARIFGIIETVQGKYQLTDLGFAIVDSKRERAARADAFLRVPLYRRVYEEFRNRQLPPRPVALERTFVGFGVAAKQADRARHAFDRSAQQAGFFDQGGRDRLIRPPTGSVDPGAGADVEPLGELEQPPPPPPPGRRRNGGGGGGNYHPFIEGLLETLPEPGTVWSIEGRAAWLEAAASAFKLIYQGDGRIRIATETEGSPHGA